MRLFPSLGQLTTQRGRSALLLSPFDPSLAFGPAATIRRAVVAALRQNLDLAALVGDRIFDRFVPEDVSERPCLVYTFGRIERPRNLDGPDGTATARVGFETVTSLDATGEAGEAGEAVGEVLRKRFDGLANTTLPGPVSILEAWSDDDKDSLESPDDDAEPIIPTEFAYVFRYRESIPRH